MKLFSLGRLVFTAIEAATLLGWLALTRVNAVAAVIVLLVGLIAEHLVSFNVAQSRPLFKLQGQPLAGIALSSAIETVAWIYLLTLAPVRVALAFGLIQVGHAIELNNVNRFPSFTKFFNRLKAATRHSLIEDGVGLVGILVWPTSPLAALFIFLIGLYVEHFFASRAKLG